ncbi:MAG: stress response translation initiation inhibitor YciH [Nanoarchaeota archaeon]|nr:stress response translation initiation inhibitor YciH [Nanoarchaeota archaeon]
MSDVCPVCGMPKELCICGAITKEQLQIKVRVAKKRYGRLMTIIEGIDPKAVDMKALAKRMKQKFACGGTVKNDTIELQGDHRERVKQILIEEGFPPENIEVI